MTLWRVLRVWSPRLRLTVAGASAAFFFLLTAPHPRTPSVSFDDISARSGIDAVLHNSPTPEKHQIETMAGGVAAFDYDNDGLIDIFLTNGARQPELTKPDASWWNRLYRNRGNNTFEDIT